MTHTVRLTKDEVEKAIVEAVIEADPNAEVKINSDGSATVEWVVEA